MTMRSAMRRFAVRSAGSGWLARDERRDSAAARCAAAGGRTRCVDRRRSDAEEIDDRLGSDAEARNVLFEWSMAEFVEHYLTDERLQVALSGAGRDRHECEPVRCGHGFDSFSSFVGTAGRDAGHVGLCARAAWGWFRLFLATRRARRAQWLRRVFRWRRFFRARAWCWRAARGFLRAVVISNADPRRTLTMLGDAADTRGAAQVESVPIEGCTVKLNVLMRELPNFTARPGTLEAHHYGQINAPLTKQEWKDGFAAARRGELPEHLWCELYFQSVHDATRCSCGAAYDERLCAVCSLCVCEEARGIRGAMRCGGWRWIRWGGSARIWIRR